MDEVTLVTALFDLGRGQRIGQLADHQSRPFSEYLSHFERVLSLDAPLCVYVEPQLEAFVWRFRDPARTRVIHRPLAHFSTCFPFYDEVQRLRQDPAWRGRAAWLAESPQANLPLYNPVVMSKMGMLNDQQLLNPFGTERFLWIDAGLARTCGAYMQEARPPWLDRIAGLLERFLFICFPYIGGQEVHGFDRLALARMAGTDYIRRVARGGLFGGSRESIASANRLYHRLLEISFSQGEMGTEESIFSAMCCLAPEQFDRFDIGADGLIGPFLEALGQGPVGVQRSRRVDVTAASASQPGVLPGRAPAAQVRKAEEVSLAFYVLTFNQPQQLALLLDSWRQQPELFKRSTVYVLDNSTEPEAVAQNARLCEAQGLQHLPQGNLGICGGRQRAAELFEASAHDYMVFLEDDMLLSRPAMPPCRSGFVTWVDRLDQRLIEIMEKERFDFLKLSFTEVYGANHEQWAWYNVPAAVRGQVWPDQTDLPVSGLAQRIPPVVFERIGTEGGLAYATGQVYYSNWPQIVGREGNRRMFLETRWARPYEQTWMSHLFQETRAGRLRPAVLLASPIDHRREFHYRAEERVES